MNGQEEQIVRLLLNVMAFEGAMKHFGEPPPDIDIELFHKLDVPAFRSNMMGTLKTTGMRTSNLMATIPYL